MINFQALAIKVKRYNLFTFKHYSDFKHQNWSKFYMKQFGHVLWLQKHYRLQNILVY